MNAYRSDGWGLASAFEAMFSGHDGDWYTNTKLPFGLHEGVGMMSHWFYEVGIRDFVVLQWGLMILVTQRFFPLARPSRSSPESYNQTLGDALYDWSYQQVAPYL
jgi:hypothetical protein